MLVRVALPAGHPRMGRQTGKCTSTTAVSTTGRAAIALYRPCSSPLRQKQWKRQWLCGDSARPGRSKQKFDRLPLANRHGRAWLRDQYHRSSGRSFTGQRFDESSTSHSALRLASPGSRVLRATGEDPAWVVGTVRLVESDDQLEDFAHHCHVGLCFPHPLLELPAVVGPEEPTSGDQLVGHLAQDLPGQWAPFLRDFDFTLVVPTLALPKVESHILLDRLVDLKVADWTNAS